MEEKKITEKESLELITLMIENTKNNLEKKSGLSLLLWGYVSALVALAIFAGWQITENFSVFWGWWAIPLLGYPLQWMVNKKATKRVVTYIDHVVHQIWKIVGICAVLTPLACLFAQVQVLFVEALLISIGVTITGLVVKYRLLAVMGGMGILLSYLLLFVSGEYQILIFALLFVLLMIVPGHLLHRAGIREHAKKQPLCSGN